MSNESILKIEGTEVKIEVESEWEESYFYDEYNQAFQSVQRIIDDNLDKKLKENLNENSNKNVDSRYNKIHNIIPFVGKRGTGKTSVMMSFSAMLENYSGNARKNTQFYVFKDSNGEKQKVGFYCTDCIDGSLLEKGEDIFKLILAQIYGMFIQMDKNGRPRDKSYEYEKRELQQSFDEVFRSICDLEKEGLKDIYYEESAITSLKSLSSSLDLTKKFEKLICRYLNVLKMGRVYEDNAENFLVVMVDDLDLNIPGGYEMLEKIHRYMMVKNVIVMLTIDYDQIKLLCEKQLYSMVPKFDTKLNEKRKYVECVARDFLDKIFPGNVRIYMPVFDKLKNVMVKDSKSEKAKSTRDVLFQLLYDKLGLRMDIEGTKRHFYEQSSLRTFASFYLMLKSMQSLSGLDESKRKEVFLKNYKRLLSDTLNRMTEERMDDKHKEIFRRITKSDLLHSFRNFYIEVLNYDSFKDFDLEKESWSERNEKKHLIELAHNIEKSGYSYGELLRIVYCWGRIDNESKEMIRCLLAYYSLEFFKEYNELKWDKDDENDKRRKQCIDIINGSVVGSWANKIVPEVYLQKESHVIGMRTNLDMRSVFEFDIDLSKFYLDNNKIISQNCDEDKVLGIVKTILIYGMFFEQPSYKRGKSDRWRIKIEKQLYSEQKSITDDKVSEDEVTPRDNEKRLEEEGLSDLRKGKIRVCGIGKTNFNIFGFVSNAFQYREKVLPLVEDICDDLFREKDLKEKVLEHFENEFNEWEKVSKGFALPIYNMDITYNLTKRLRQRNMGKDNVPFENIWKEVLEIYKFMYEHLKVNDEYYGNMYGKNSEMISFSEAFIKCPYMKWIFTISEDGTIKENDFTMTLAEKFEKNLLDIISNVIQKGPVLGKSTEKEYQSYDD